jgi:hypothetical protein
MYIKGLPPKMIRTSVFYKRFNYTKNQLRTLLRDRHVVAKTFKNLLLVAPNPCSWIWSKEVLEEFWGKDYSDRL